MGGTERERESDGEGEGMERGGGGLSVEVITFLSRPPNDVHSRPLAGTDWSWSQSC